MGTLYHAAFTHGLQTVRELDSSTALELLKKSVANWHLSIVLLSLSLTLMVRIAEAGWQNSKYLILSLSEGDIDQLSTWTLRWSQLGFTSAAFLVKGISFCGYMIGNNGERSMRGFGRLNIVWKIRDTSVLFLRCKKREPYRALVGHEYGGSTVVNFKDVPYIMNNGRILILTSLFCRRRIISRRPLQPKYLLATFSTGTPHKNQNTSPRVPDVLQTSYVQQNQHVAYYQTSCSQLWILFILGRA